MSDPSRVGCQRCDWIGLRNRTRVGCQRCDWIGLRNRTYTRRVLTIRVLVLRNLELQYTICTVQSPSNNCLEVVTRFLGPKHLLLWPCRYMYVRTYVYKVATSFWQWGLNFYHILLVTEALTHFMFGTQNNKMYRRHLSESYHSDIQHFQNL